MTSARPWGMTPSALGGVPTRLSSYGSATFRGLARPLPAVSLASPSPQPGADPGLLERRD